MTTTMRHSPRPTLRTEIASTAFAACVAFTLSSTVVYAFFSPGGSAAKAREADYYGVLGVTPQASIAEVRRAYREKALKYHPDRSPSLKRSEATEQFLRLSEAYQVLRDTTGRSIYDRLRAGRGKGRFTGYGIRIRDPIEVFADEFSFQDPFAVFDGLNTVEVFDSDKPDHSAVKLSPEDSAAVLGLRPTTTSAGRRTATGANVAGPIQIQLFNNRARRLSGITVNGKRIEMDVLDEKSDQGESAPIVESMVSVRQNGRTVRRHARNAPGGTEVTVEEIDNGRIRRRRGVLPLASGNHRHEDDEGSNSGSEAKADEAVHNLYRDRGEL